MFTLYTGLLLQLRGLIWAKQLPGDRGSPGLSVRRMGRGLRGPALLSADLHRGQSRLPLPGYKPPGDRVSPGRGSGALPSPCLYQHSLGLRHVHPGQVRRNHPGRQVAMTMESDIRDEAKAQWMAGLQGLAGPGGVTASGPK